MWNKINFEYVSIVIIIHRKIFDKDSKYIDNLKYIYYI